MCSSDGLDQGTTFTMMAPVFYYAAGDVEHGVPEIEVNCQADATESIPPQPEEILPLNILVVDDAATNRRLLTRLLTNHGHMCDGAEDGNQAVRLVAANMKQDEETGKPLYDTILLDYEMPEMNGPTAAKEMRRMGCDAFIVGITGNVLPDDVDYFISCGANEVLPKPFNITDLEGLWVEYGVGIRSRQETLNFNKFHATPTTTMLLPASRRSVTFGGGENSAQEEHSSQVESSTQRQQQQASSTEDGFTEV